MSKKAAREEASELPKCPKCNNAGMVIARPKGVYECIGCHSEFKLEKA